MKKQVLFIQGAGEGAYVEDEELAATLQAALGAEYQVLYPQMPNEGDPDYELWKGQIKKELAALDDKAMIIGHSLGGSFLLKYLAEEQIEKRIAGLFLMAAPYWGGDGWQYEGYEQITLPESFASKLPQGAPIFLYHSRDDEIVPFAHLALYAEKLPQATIREFDGHGHQFNNDLSEVAADMLNLSARISSV
ncbi:MAG: alpha/beta fold hydrolase [Ardenticatenaceae bacterium]|nr:alpha/beta fold hydrolase [Ardenticatenaceae bacterium]